jgi:hypothetical protein
MRETCWWLSPMIAEMPSSGSPSRYARRIASSLDLGAGSALPIRSADRVLRGRRDQRHDVLVQRRDPDPHALAVARSSLGEANLRPVGLHWGPPVRFKSVERAWVGNLRLQGSAPPPPPRTRSHSGFGVLRPAGGSPGITPLSLMLELAKEPESAGVQWVRGRHRATARRVRAGSCRCRPRLSQVPPDSRREVGTT